MPAATRSPTAARKFSFPVYVIAVLAAGCWRRPSSPAARCGWCSASPAAAVTYYNVPLLERRPTIGANQYGIFIQGFGLIRWRAIDRIDLVEIAVRASTIHELQIGAQDAAVAARSSPTGASSRSIAR